MKIMSSILWSLILLLGCQSKTTKKTANNNTRITPKEWVHYRAKDDVKNGHIVLISGDEEYRSEEALPQLAKILTHHHGFDCTVLFAQDPEKPGIIDPNYRQHIPGLDQLEEADLMIISTRFRSLPVEQMRHIDNYLLDGKPVIGIRTATHAFNIDEGDHPFKHYDWRYNGDKTEWHGGFGKLVLGETWVAHHGRHKHQSARGIIAPEAENHPLINGIEDGSMWGPTDVYRIRMPIGGDAQSIILGQSIDREGDVEETDPFYGMRESDNQIAVDNKGNDPEKVYNPNDPMPPIVWTKSYVLPGGQTGQALTSTIGSSTDMADEEVRRLFVNATYHLLDLRIPEKATVDIVGKYSPSPFAFHDDQYWEVANLNVRVHRSHAE